MNSLVDKLRKVERDLTQRKGPFLLFALLLREDAPDVWDVLVSAPWADVDRGDALREISAELSRVADPEELKLVSKIAIVDQFDPALAALRSAFDVENAAVEVRDSELFGLRVSRAFIITSRRSRGSASKAPAGHYVLTKNRLGAYWFALCTEDGRDLLRSELYSTRSAAELGIATVRKNCPLAERYVRKRAANGDYFFNLIAGNHQIIGTSNIYTTISAMENGIEAVMANGRSHAMRDNTKPSSVDP